MRFLLLQAALVLALALPALGAAAAEDARVHPESVVSVTATLQPWDVYQPWDREYPEEVGCSGFFIEQGVLTNAHCVAEASFIEVDVPGAKDRVPAEIAAINHQVDLALLQLPPGAARKPAVTFGALPQRLDAVITVGFPVGGEQISLTEGVVSRIDVQPYAQSNIASLLIQTDAALNAGNSGGPVFARATGRCVGVATQLVEDAKGLGYFIPTPVIRQFLRDVEDGRVDGITNLGIKPQALENDALRAAMRLTPSQSGVRVAAVAAGGSADGIIEPGDVILSIDGTAIHNDGGVTFTDGSTMALDVLFSAKQVGDVVEVGLLRAGEARAVPVTLKGYRTSIVPALPRYGERPRYRIVGGLVLLVVDRRYLAAFEAGEIPPRLAVYQDAWVGTDGLEELIVISRVLAAPINEGYRDDVVDVRVTAVNGMPVTSFATLNQALARAPDGPYIEIALESGAIIRLRTDAVKRTAAALLRRYGASE